MLLGKSFRSRRLTSTGVSPATPDLSRSFDFNDDFLLLARSTAPAESSHNTDYATPVSLARRRFGLFRVRSPLLAESLLFSLPVGTEMVHFPTFAPYTYVFSVRLLGITPVGFPHSEIPGSTPVCGSPRLIAAYHVLHRLPTPRHPPYALSSLT